MTTIQEYIDCYDAIAPCFLCGDALDVLRTLPSDSIDCVITSPPYYMKRQYLGGDRIGGFLSRIHR